MSDWHRRRVVVSLCLVLLCSALARDLVDAGVAVHRVYLPMVLRSYRSPLQIVLGSTNIERGLTLDWGGDVDSEVVSVGSPAVEARRTGNGQVLPAPDANQTADYYLQFRADDAAIFGGVPTTRLRIEVEYLDEGTDGFFLEYDAQAGGPYGDGRFKATAWVAKSNTRRFKTLTLTVGDAFFGNRDNGADFRLVDGGDGAETIRRVSVTLLPPGPYIINVDSCGANPWDNNPDSSAIQACFDQAFSGDTVTFTSGVNSPGYRGYIVDKTIFLVANSAKDHVLFTSTNPANHALLRASADLKGFVVRLFARSRVFDSGSIDDITLRHLSLDGGRELRRCFGADGIENGVDDSWGSWLAECSLPGDPWCRAGTLGMDGAMDWEDTGQQYLANSSQWSTGLVVEDVSILSTECGSAFGLSGAACTIRRCEIGTAGDHVHGAGCSATENDEGLGDWSDGITCAGPNHLISGNTITNPSDVGIVFFGGKDTVISNNAVHAAAGNYGMFAGIAIHPWIFGDVSGMQIIDNQVTGNASETCGGIHAGINIGTHMWGGGCVDSPHSSAVGNSNACVGEPAPPQGALCAPGFVCQEWAHVAAGRSLTLQGNYVAGAHINYLIEGLDLVGTLSESGNTSGTPRLSDWEAARRGCVWDSVTDRWGALDRVAHHPGLPGWVDQRVHCER